MKPVEDIEAGNVLEEAHAPIHGALVCEAGRFSLDRRDRRVKQGAGQRPCSEVQEHRIVRYGPQPKDRGGSVVTTDMAEVNGRRYRGCDVAREHGW